MVGTITQPEWIYICTDALRTLSPREFRAGIAEVLKTFILFDAEYYRKAVDYFARMEAHLRKAGTCCGGECVYGQEELTEIIRKTALYKCAVVERDAFEKGERRLLNLGHTFAHAIEKIVRSCTAKPWRSVWCWLPGCPNGWDSPRRDWRSVWRRI